MKQHKFFQFLFLAFMFVGTFTLSSCKSEGCTNEFSDNFDADADDDDGSCILSREKFIASYDMVETCPSGEGNYTLTISASSSADNAVIIYGGAPANGTVSASSITMPSQDLDIAGQMVNIEGTGSITEDVLTMTFIYTNAAGSQTCIAVGTKQ